MPDSKIDWPNFFLAITAIVVGFALAAWGVLTINKIWHPGEFVACPYGYQPVDPEKPECAPASIVTVTVTSTATATEVTP